MLEVEMQNDFEIGRVVAVDTAEVTIELSRDLKALTQNTYEGAREIGKINSYVILPVGARRLIAIITRVVLVEEAELKTNRTMVTLPSARRLMKATLIGTIDGNIFTQGIATFPVLDNPVQVATKADLQAIFDLQETPDVSPNDPKSPGFCIEIGRSAVFEDFPVQIDPDAFFGKHAAILGSTGSGKSCTIATIVQSILARPEVHQTNIVILDTNGEYRTAFQQEQSNGTWKSLAKARCLYIPSDPAKPADRLTVPYWFLNTDDFVRLFQASQGVQRPVLLEALRLARNEEESRTPAGVLKEMLVIEFNRIWSFSGRDEKTSKTVWDLAKGLLNWMLNPERAAAWSELAGVINGVTKEIVVQTIEKVRDIADAYVDRGTYSKVLPCDARSNIRAAINPIYTKLTGTALGRALGGEGISADAPKYFDKIRFRTQYIEQVLRREEAGGARARDFSGTMLLRIDRLLADSRFDFLFGPIQGKFPEVKHSLAAFLRDILGLPTPADLETLHSGIDVAAEKVMPFYDRQRRRTLGHNVVVLDLSLLAAEVLENVTALIGRLILEFMQRLGEQCGEGMRGSLPVVLVLEEAQNYIHEHRFGDDESISRVVFERIAREGRKYGLSLVVASQRPSEVSKTVLSQCSSFIVHRIQNPEDLRYFKEIIPGIYAALLAQVSALAPQTALVLGECVRAPVLVRIREARPTPRSKDPRFYAYWVNVKPQPVPVETVCCKWEGNNE
jgi:hypothetical protein